MVKHKNIEFMVKNIRKKRKKCGKFPKSRIQLEHAATKSDKMNSCNIPNRNSLKNSPTD
jgi:hypothetical protein